MIDKRLLIVEGLLVYYAVKFIMETFKDKIRVDFQSFQITKQDTPATFAPLEEYDKFLQEHGYHIVSE